MKTKTLTMHDGTSVTISITEKEEERVAYTVHMDSFIHMAAIANFQNTPFTFLTTKFWKPKNLEHLSALINAFETTAASVFEWQHDFKVDFFEEMGYQ